MTNKVNTVTIIEPKGKWYQWGIQETLHYVNLILLFVRRDFKLQYKQTVLGPLWLFLGPFITACIYSFLFGTIAKVPTEGVPHLLFYLVGLNLWIPFSTCVLQISRAFQQNMAIFSKVYFPRLVWPISQTIGCLINYFIMLLSVLFFYFYYFFTGQVQAISWKILMLPVFVLQSCILALGIGLIVKSLSTKYRDVGLAINYIMTVWMFASPIVYALSALDGWLLKAALINPITPIITNIRYLFLGVGEFMWSSWFMSIGVTFLLLCLGLYLHSRVERTFIDTV